MTKHQADKTSIEGISAASFYHWVEALVPHMFFNFYLVKSHTITYNSATTEAREKNKPIFGMLRIKKRCMFD